ncbi:hypothetical protein TURU_108484 [Turdus rufiventris]|nr:hypothetical protein TURU_108484 [Turdus rufiventris]
MPLEERGRRLRCNPERSEGERELPLPGNELERDPADKEIFKVQLMSEMSHWLNETKVTCGRNFVSMEAQPPAPSADLWRKGRENLLAASKGAAGGLQVHGKDVQELFPNMAESQMLLVTSTS